MNTCTKARRQLVRVLRAATRSSVAYLDHNHREGEDVRFLAVCPIVQDLRRSPSRGMVVLARGVWPGTNSRGDRCKTKIRDPRMAGSIHEDVWLDARQCSGKTGVKLTKYPLEVSVNHIARVEVTEALGDVRRLVKG